MKVDPVLRDAASWGVFGIIALGVGYVLIKWGIPAIAKAAQDSAKAGLNAASQSTDATGNSVDYTNGAAPSVVSALAGGTNTLLGGYPASAGESIGSGLFSWFNGSNAGNGSSTTYNVAFPDGTNHYVDSSTVDSNSRFTYGGVQYTLGDDGSGHKIATALTTVYGSGSGGGLPVDFGVDPNSWG